MRVVDRWIDRPWLDWVIVALASVVVWFRLSADLLPTVERASLYQTLASIAMAMLGLGSVTATLIVTVTPNERLRAVKDQVGQNLIRLIFSCLINFLFSTAIYIWLYFYITPSSVEYRNALFVAGTTILFLSIVRLIWLLRRVLVILI